MAGRRQHHHHHPLWSKISEGFQNTKVQYRPVSVTAEMLLKRNKDCAPVRNSSLWENNAVSK